jgi:hypothetical protein
MSKEATDAEKDIEWLLGKDPAFDEAEQEAFADKVSELINDLDVDELSARHKALVLLKTGGINTKGNKA